MGRPRKVVLLTTLSTLSLWFGICAGSGAETEAFADIGADLSSGSPSERVLASLEVLKSELNAQVASRHSFFETAIGDCTGKEATLRTEVDNANVEVRQVVDEIEAAQQSIEHSAGTLMKLQKERGVSERVTAAKVEELNAISKSLTSAEKNSRIVRDQHEQNIKSLEKSFGTIGGLITYIQRSYQHQAALKVQLDPADIAALKKVAEVAPRAVPASDPVSPSAAGIRSALTIANANAGSTEPEVSVPATTASDAAPRVNTTVASVVSATPEESAAAAAAAAQANSAVVAALPVAPVKPAAPVATNEPVSEAVIEAVTAENPASTPEVAVTTAAPAAAVASPVARFKQVFSEIVSVHGPMRQHRHHQTVQELRDAIDQFQALPAHHGRSLLNTVRRISPGKSYRQGMSEKIYSLLRKMEGMIKNQRTAALHSHVSITETNTKLLKAMLKQKAGVEVTLNREAAKRLPEQVKELEGKLGTQKSIVKRKETWLNDLREKLLAATNRLEDVSVKCKTVKASKATFDGRTTEQRSMIGGVHAIISDRVSKVRHLMDQKLDDVSSMVSPSTKS